MGSSPTQSDRAVVSLFSFLKRYLCFHFFKKRPLFFIFIGTSVVISYIYKYIFSENQFFFSMDFLDEELGIYKSKQESNWIIKFKNTAMIKWFIIKIKLISKGLVNFPPILIFFLLCSSVYPNILSAINSIIISLLMTFVIFLH